MLYCVQYNEFINHFRIVAVCSWNPQKEAFFMTNRFGFSFVGQFLRGDHWDNLYRANYERISGTTVTWQRILIIIIQDVIAARLGDEQKAGGQQWRPTRGNPGVSNKLPTHR